MNLLEAVSTPLITATVGNQASHTASAPVSFVPEFIPLISPEPPRLSQHAEGLQEIEAAGVYSNYGPMNTLLEGEFIERVFGVGSCVTVCNATIGLMLAIREVTGDNRHPARRYAVMPSFTFAATAQAALWCGLTPLFCDIDPHTWLPDMQQLESLLQQYVGQIAVMVPYATFGNNLDLAAYHRLAEIYQVPVVVDAAASLGSLDTAGRAAGAGFPWPVVFSMHATKVFSVGEGGLIYSGDRERIARLRNMGSFGFQGDRSAHVLGLNSKMSEVAAFTARLQLRRYAGILERSEFIAKAYRDGLGGAFALQEQTGLKQAKSFQAVLLPADLPITRAEVIEGMRAAGVGLGSYFSPHLAQQPLFQETAVSAPLPITEDVAARIVSLPLRASMALSDVDRIIAALYQVTGLGMAPASTRTSLPFAVPSPGEAAATNNQQNRAA